MPHPVRIGCLVLLGALTFPAGRANAQLNTTFERMFTRILVDDFFSDANAQGNFDEAAARANAAITPALNSLIAANVSSFPLTSTIAGLSLDLSSGVPELYRGSQGPIFAETAETLGPLKINLGVNYSYYALRRLRGRALDDARFTLTAEDVDETGVLGDHPMETETIDLFPDLSVEAHAVVAFVTVGVLRNLDVSVALPLLSLSLSGRARAVINSTSLSEFGAALNNFNGDINRPVLEDTYAYDESATGIGDVAVRVKFAPVQNNGGVALLVDARLPTGAEEDFLSTGGVNVKVLGIFSKTLGTTTPHLNVGYDYRDADFDSDEVEFVVGFDQRLGPGLTFAFEIMGEFDLNTDEAIVFPGTETLSVEKGGVLGPSTTRIDVALSNIPDLTDHVLNLSAGGKWAPSPRVSLLANVIVPLQDGGLRARVTPTLGAAVNF